MTAPSLSSVRFAAVNVDNLLGQRKADFFFEKSSRALSSTVATVALVFKNLHQLVSRKPGSLLSSFGRVLSRHLASCLAPILRYSVSVDRKTSRRDSCGEREPLVASSNPPEYGKKVESSYDASFYEVRMEETCKDLESSGFL